MVTLKNSRKKTTTLSLPKAQPRKNLLGLIPVIGTLMLGTHIATNKAQELIQENQIEQQQKRAAEEQTRKRAFLLSTSFEKLNQELNGQNLSELRKVRRNVRALIDEYNQFKTDENYARLQQIGQIETGRTEEIIAFFEKNLRKIDQIKKAKPLRELSEEEKNKAFKGTLGRDNQRHIDYPYLISTRKLAAKVELQVPKRNAKGQIVTKNGEPVMQNKTHLAPTKDELELIYQTLKMYENPAKAKYDPVKSMQAIQAIKTTLTNAGYTLASLPDEEDIPEDQKQTALTYDKFTKQLDASWNATTKYYLDSIKKAGIKSAVSLPDGSLEISFGLPRPTRSYIVNEHSTHKKSVAATAVNLHVINGVGAPIMVPSKSTGRVIITPSMLRDPRNGLPAQAVLSLSQELSTGAPEGIHARFILNTKGELEDFQTQALEQIRRAFTTPTSVEKEEFKLYEERTAKLLREQKPNKKPPAVEQPEDKRFQTTLTPLWYKDKDGKIQKMMIPHTDIRPEFTFKWSSPEKYDEHMEQKTEQIKNAIEKTREKFPVLTLNENGQVTLLGLEKELGQETPTEEPVQIDEDAPPNLPVVPEENLKIDNNTLQLKGDIDIQGNNRLDFTKSHAWLEQTQRRRKTA